MSFSQKYLEEVTTITSLLDPLLIEEMAGHLAAVKERDGRLFILGVGGSAANASHAVNDFRKLAGIQSYTPTDNVAELTARTNDEGWSSVFAEWLRTSRLNQNDAIFILSVGGGDIEKNISPNLVKAVQFAKEKGAMVLAIVGRKEGYAAQTADCAIVIPKINSDHVTPHTEAFQSVICHLLISHPKLKRFQTKWESVQLKKAAVKI